MKYPPPTCLARENSNLAKVELLAGKFKRPLRVAHVGNIANNAYLAAKDQRRIGIEAHVFSPDYVHVMGFPEWEECHFQRSNSRGHFDPEFPEVDYEKPYWFHWGSWEGILKSFAHDNQKPINTRNEISRLNLMSNRMTYNLWKFFRPFLKSITPIRFRAWAVNSILIQLRKPGAIPAQLILNSFDIVHFYGPYNYLTTLVQINPPFISTEHGTLRDYIFSSHTQAKMSKIGYQNSKAVIVTNQDSFPSALKAGIPSQRILFGPHPINEDNFDKLNQKRLEFKGERLKVLIPARQVKKSSIDAGKGNSEILAAIRKSIDAELPYEFLIPLWGDDVESTLNYAKELGITKGIQWLPLLSRPALQNLMNECVGVIDQMNVRAYGAVGADALALGVPLITSSGLQNDQIAFGEKAPVLDATNADMILNHLKILADPEFDFKSHAEKSQKWYRQHISMEIASSRALDAYIFALRNELRN